MTDFLGAFDIENSVFRRLFSVRRSRLSKAAAEGANGERMTENRAFSVKRPLHDMFARVGDDTPKVRYAAVRYARRYVMTVSLFFGTFRPSVRYAADFIFFE